MKNFSISKMRLAGFFIFLVIVLAWNMALSSRRKYFSGKLEPVIQKDLVLTVNCPGKIEPKIQETVRSLIDGPKKMVHVKEGDSVKRGQLLMEIGDDNIRMEIYNKKTAYRNASLELEKANKELSLSRRLFRQLAISKKEVESAEQTKERAEQTVFTAREELQNVEKKQGGTLVYSPLDGVVLKNFIENDNQVSSGKELFKVAQVDKLIVRGKVDELEISQINVGQSAVIRCDAFAGVEMTGQVSWIGAQAADNSFADVPVLVDILDAKDLKLKANMSADVKINTGQIPQAIVIPSAAVRQSEKGPFVLKASKAGWLMEQPITITRVSSGQAIVGSGLSADQFVLVPPEE